MSNITSTMLRGDAPEFYNTTPFQFDRSADALSNSVVVTTTITGPAGSWAGSVGPVVSAPDAPPVVPPTDKAGLSD